MSFIKLDRKIQDWGWFKDNTTFKLWVYLLLNANYGTSEYFGKTIERGVLPFNFKKVSDETGLSEKQIRTSMSKLKKTGEIETTRYSRFLLVKCMNYDKYQSEGQSQVKSEVSSQVRSEVRSHIYKNIRNKEIKNIYNDRLPVYDSSKNTVMSEEEEEEILNLMGRGEA